MEKKEREIKIREKRALYEIKKFSKRAKELIDGITPEDLLDGGLNPYMTAALGLNVEESIEMFIHKRVERSLGTSFGTVIEKFLAELLGGKRGKEFSGCTGRRGGKRPWYCWWDIRIDRPYKEGKMIWRGVVLAVKSAATNINKDIAEEFIRHAKEAEDYGYRPFLVFTYGKRVWSVIAPTMRAHGMDPGAYVLVGRGVYEKLLGDPKYYERIIDMIINEVQASELEFSNAVEAKKEELLSELKKKFGEEISNDLKNLLKKLT
ncbi:MAG: hypothetical protein J7L78_02750 [Dehalococcoidales bacterium]|nr:hypothetical protein [Dehalococcoidales bacterium]